MATEVESGDHVTLHGLDHETKQSSSINILLSDTEKSNPRPADFNGSQRLDPSVAEPNDKIAVTGTSGSDLAARPNQASSVQTNSDLRTRVAALEVALARMHRAAEKAGLDLDTDKTDLAISEHDKKATDETKDDANSSESDLTISKHDTKAMNEAKDDTSAETGPADVDYDAVEPIIIGNIQRVTPRQWRRTGGKPILANDKKVAFYIEQENSADSGHPQAEHGSDAPDQAISVSSTALGDGVPKSVFPPTKLAINSTALIIMLARAAETGSTPLPDDFNTNRNTFVRPFKYLLAHEGRIRDFYVKFCAFLQQRRQRLGTVQEGESAETVESCGKDHWNAPKTAQSKTDCVVAAPESPGESTATKILDYDPNSRFATLLEDLSQLSDRQLLLREWLWRALIDFMDKDMQDILAARRAIANGEVDEIEFDKLWHLYKPGDLIVARHGTAADRWRAYRVIHVTGGRKVVSSQHDLPPSPQPAAAHEDVEQDMSELTTASSQNTPFVIDCFYVDFDGHQWGPRPRTFTIRPYSGSREIPSLQAYPIQYHPDKNLRDKLIQRGRQFVQCARQSHKQYSGLTHPDKRLRSTQAELHCKVVIDQAAGVEFLQNVHPDWAMDFGASVLNLPTQGDRRENFEWIACQVAGCRTCTDLYNDFLVDWKRREDYMKDNPLLICCTAHELTDDHLALLPNRVYGYALQDRRWYALYVDTIEDITTRPSEAFNDLVLEGSHRRLIQALVRNQTRGPFRSSARQEPFVGSPNILNNMDLVPGKGRGLIILLHGVPGVGKTSTAECVAAQLGSPLFPITCGDLGTDPERVEDRLEEYFNLAQRWGCVLLLDEADVFLAKRTPGELNRNALVSVFLRILEYYAGVLILTTNRIGEFDEAFRSRIHMSLYYPPLTENSYRRIWEKNLERIAKTNEFDFDPADILQFADSHWQSNINDKKLDRQWNGRQIKNACQTAMALANWDFHEGGLHKTLQRPSLQTKHFTDVAVTSAHFDDYLVSVYEANHYSLAASENHLRKDTAQKLKSKNLQWASKNPSTPSRPRLTPKTSSAAREPVDSPEELDEDFEVNNAEDERQAAIAALVKQVELLQASSTKSTPAKPMRSSRKQARELMMMHDE